MGKIMSDEYGFIYETVYGVPNRVRIHVPTKGKPLEEYQNSGLEFEEWLKTDAGGEWAMEYRSIAYYSGGLYKAKLRSEGHMPMPDWACPSPKEDEVKTGCQCGGPAGHVVGGMNCRK